MDLAFNCKYGNFILSKEYLEPYSKKSFVELEKDKYIIAIGRLENAIKFYDGKKLIRDVYENLIAPSAPKKVQVKDFRCPFSKKRFTEILFFLVENNNRIFLGNSKDFLNSFSVRREIFFNEDILDCLSIAFSEKKLKNKTKKQIFTLFLTIFAVFFITTVLFLVFERRKLKIENIKDKLEWLYLK